MKYCLVSDAYVPLFSQKGLFHPPFLPKKFFFSIFQIKDTHHDHLVRFIGVVADAPQKYILTEYCPKGKEHAIKKWYQLTANTGCFWAPSIKTASTWTSIATNNYFALFLQDHCKIFSKMKIFNSNGVSENPWFTI